jgi:hypothetical protein
VFADITRPVLQAASASSAGDNLGLTKSLQEMMSSSTKKPTCARFEGLDLGEMDIVQGGCYNGSFSWEIRLIIIVD